MAAGLAVIFACGVTWLAFLRVTGARRPPTALRLGLYPFLLVDVLKILLGAAVLPALWKAIAPGR